MEISFDENKRLKTLAERGLDFKRASDLFTGIHLTKQDSRRDYGEVRQISIGMIESVVVVVVWTTRNGRRRIISMRKADQDERGGYFEALE